MADGPPSDTDVWRPGPGIGWDGAMADPDDLNVGVRRYMHPGADRRARAVAPPPLRDEDITTELTASVRQVLDVYDAALDVVTSWLDLRAAPSRLALVDAHGAHVDALARALAVAGVLERGSTLDPAAVVVLSPRPGPDGPGVTTTPADGPGS